MARSYWATAISLAARIIDALAPKTVANAIHHALLPLGIHCHRPFMRGAIEISYYVAIGLGLGLRSFHVYARRPGMQYRKKSSSLLGYPEIAGLATGISVLGSALSFLLVFRLSWSFSQWYEARGLIGQSMTRLRAIFVLYISNYGKRRPGADDIAQRQLVAEACTLLKLHAATVAVDLCYDARDIVRFQSLSPRSRFKRALSLMETIVDEHTTMLENELAMLDRARAKRYEQTHRRVLLCSSWLQQSINRARETHFITDTEHLTAHEHVTNLLSAYYSLMKIKTTDAPAAIQLLVFILKASYCLALYPQFLAYAFVMKLDDEQREDGAIVRTFYFPIFYMTLVTLGIIYFVTLHLIALELDDPFGDDISDFPLLKWALALSDELDDVSTFYDTEHTLHDTSLVLGSKGAASPVLDYSDVTSAVHSQSAVSSSVKILARDNSVATLGAPPVYQATALGKRGMGPAEESEPHMLVEPPPPPPARAHVMQSIQHSASGDTEALGTSPTSSSTASAIDSGE